MKHSLTPAEQCVGNQVRKNLGASLSVYQHAKLNFSYIRKRKRKNVTRGSVSSDSLDRDTEMAVNYSFSADVLQTSIQQIENLADHPVGEKAHTVQPFHRSQRRSILPAYIIEYYIL